MEAGNLSVTKECHPLLKPMVPLVKMLGEMLGKDYEIALHDLTGEKPELVEYVHSSVTGRSENSPMTALGNFLMNSSEAGGIEYIANYQSEAADGRRLRSGTSLIRDEDGRLVGFLCVNYDVTNANLIKDLGEFLTKATPLTFKGVEHERFERVRDADSMIDAARRRFGKPLSFLSSEERRQCIQYLDEEGFFNFKGAVEGLAKEMNKSRFTLYADLRSVRN